MLGIPHEIDIGGVYLSPILVAGFIAFFATLITVRLLNRFRLSRYFARPPIVFLSLSVIYTVGLLIFAIPG